MTVHSKHIRNGLTLEKKTQCLSTGVGTNLSIYLYNGISLSGKQRNKKFMVNRKELDMNEYTLYSHLYEILEQKNLQWQPIRDFIGLALGSEDG